jgi:hypothetical protein
VLAYPISEEIQWGKPGHELGGFLAQQLKFQQENDEIFMNPLNERGISPIEESVTQK